jgi:hypothetical protein
LLQKAFEKPIGGSVCRQPVRMHKEIVDFVRKHQLLDVNFLFSQRLRQLDSLGERHVTVVIALYQKDG